MRLLGCLVHPSVCPFTSVAMTHFHPEYRGKSDVNMVRKAGLYPCSELQLSGMGLLEGTQKALVM